MTVEFRDEVLKKRQQSLWGKVLLRPNVFYKKCTAVMVATTVLFGFFIVFGHYTTKETVQGLIEPSSGLISIYAPSAGNVEALYKQQGEYVRSGEPLIKINFYEILSDGARYDAKLEQELKHDQQLLERQLDYIDDESALKFSEFEYQEKALMSQYQSLEKQLPLEQKNNQVLKEHLARLEKAFSKGSVPRVQLEQIQRELALSDKNLLRFLDDIEQLQLKIEQMPTLKKQIQTQHQERRLQVVQQLSQISKMLLDLDRKSHSVIVAPIDGMITQFDLKIGQTIRHGEHLVDMKHKDDQYRAKIFVPSRAIGFIHPNQDVSIRIHAFPHQHYGTIKGKIESVTESLYQGGSAESGPFYVVYVQLSQQSMLSDGRFALKQGMQLDADIQTQKMTFLQKLFEPLFRLRS